MKKKCICWLLVMGLALGLCGCGSVNKYPQFDYIDEMLARGDYAGAIAAINGLQLQGGLGFTVIPDFGDGTQQLPTAQEQEDLEVYIEIYNHLCKGETLYVPTKPGGTTFMNSSGQEALRYCYENLQRLDSVKKWAGTQYVERYDIDIWDPQALLANFTVLEDAVWKISETRLDNLGNVSQPSTVRSYGYDAAGRVIKDYRSYDMKEVTHLATGTWYYTFDDAGRVARKTLGKDTVSAIVTCTYDANGRLIAEHKKTNTEETDYRYTYDDLGRLSRIEWGEIYSEREAIDYIYDEAGRLISEVHTDYGLLYGYDDWEIDNKQIMNYVYDETGKLVSGSYVVENWQRFPRPRYGSTDQYTYTYDDQGRLSRVTIIPGDSVILSGNEGSGTVDSAAAYAEITREYIYGFYVYTPAQ
jgi:YD repeat-containing protein